MCLTASVGVGGLNRPIDVNTVQLLLNMNIGEITPIRILNIDGHAGNSTHLAIGEFQSRVLGYLRPDKRVDPKGKTLAKLRAGIPKSLTIEVLQGIMPNATTNNLKLYHKHLVKEMKSRQISTPIRRAHFLAQVAHESGSLRYVTEIASGDAYEGRTDLGNNQPGDGRKFKGRGLIQLTGRQNYQNYGDDIGIDLVNNNAWETLATNPQRAVDVAAWFWNKKGLNALADKDDLRGITRRINGGYNGLADRQHYLERSKFFLGL